MSTAAKGDSIQQRFNTSSPCPICGGWDGQKRGQGQRCHGYIDSTGAYARCTREDHAGNLPENSDRTFSHRLHGDCECGKRHGESREPAEGPDPVVATFIYRDEDKKPLFQVVKTRGKRFWQQKPDGTNGIRGIRRVLYRLPELLAADPAAPVFIPEGEKDVNNLDKRGLVATCNPGGAEKWSDDFSRHLAGRRVVILPDHDPIDPKKGNTRQGWRHAAQVARSIAPYAASVQVLDLADACRRLNLGELPAKGDVSDYLDMGGTVKDLLRLAEEAPAWAGQTGPVEDARGPAPVEGPPQLRVVTPQDDDESAPVVDLWPRIDPRAFHGLAGEIVEAVDPHTEADRVAVLAQLLVGFGNLIERRAHFVVGATKHHLNLFAALVGPTAEGKGSAWDVVRWVLGVIDPDWNRDRVQQGLVSGEGLIHHVRDPVKKKVKKNGGAEEIVEDEGVADKRLLVVETELSRALKAMNRESNTLGDVLRQAWEGGNLSTMGKNNPSRATNAHISIIAHSTRHDVNRYLTETDAANGFANRFLWACVRCSKELPDGGSLFDVDLSPTLNRLRSAADFGTAAGRMERDAEAREVWHGVYGPLKSGRTGLLGAVLSRAVPQVMRLSCLYALLDRSPVVRAEHLLAALALWKYCDDSARYIFGDRLGNPDAEKLLAALRGAPGGMTRKEITLGVFAGHKGGKALADILSDLLSQGLIHPEVDRQTGGRPAERWFLGRAN